MLPLPFDLLPYAVPMLTLFGLVSGICYYLIAQGRIDAKHRRAAKVALATALLAVPLLSVRLFLFDVTVSPTGSMMPNIQPGDIMLVDKRAYANGQTPRRGDIVAFDAPENGHHTVNRYAKRIVALEGDTVGYTSDQRLIVNGQPVQRLTLPQSDDGMDWLAETIGSAAYIIRQPLGRYDLPSPTITVPEGHFYAMGDNRFDSHDSRVYGTVPLDLIQGKVNRTPFHIASLATDD